MNDRSDDRSTVGIRIRNVGKRFERAGVVTRALEHVSLDVAEHEFIAVVGPSGCGKSTLMRLVAGLLPLEEGVIEVFGQAVRGPVTDIGIVFQKPILLEWRKVLGNVMLQLELRGLDPAAHRPRARHLLAAVGLDEFEDRYPHELSGGMQQRAAIVRALVHDPPLLLMDEPFGALDALTREQLRIDLEQLWLDSMKTVLFITHSIDEAVLLADRILVMSPRPGRVEQIAPVAIPRPRGLEGRKHPSFQPIVDQITAIFLEKGVLHGVGEHRSLAAAQALEAKP